MTVGEDMTGDLFSIGNNEKNIQFRSDTFTPKFVMSTTDFTTETIPTHIFQKPCKDRARSGT